MNKELVLKHKEEIEKELRQAKEELINAMEYYENVEENVCDLQNKLNNFKIENNLIRQMSDLKKYVGKDISKITLVEKLDNGDLIAVNKVTNYLSEEIVEIYEDGHLHYHTICTTQMVVCKYTMVNNLERMIIC